MISFVFVLFFLFDFFQMSHKETLPADLYWIFIFTSISTIFIVSNEIILMVIKFILAVFIISIYFVTISIFEISKIIIQKCKKKRVLASDIELLDQESTIAQRQSQQIFDSEERLVSMIAHEEAQIELELNRTGGIQVLNENTSQILEDN